MRTAQELAEALDQATTAHLLHLDSLTDEMRKDPKKEAEWQKKTDEGLVSILALLDEVETLEQLDGKYEG